jgi:hypothetical protein
MYSDPAKPATVRMPLRRTTMRLTTSLLVGVVLSRPDCDASFRQVDRTVDVALKTGGINFSGYDLKAVIYSFDWTIVPWNNV